ncbi:MAG: DEAD/DEAH box helicase [Pseudomonadales bacterium]|nr:DEAD/DEAH box helicase [Pseudomonadales bacterium]
MSTPELSDAQRVIDRLDLHARRIAQVYGMLFPVPPAQRRILPWLQDAEVISRRQETGMDLRAMLLRLERLGILERQSLGGRGETFRLNEPFAAPLLASAVADTELVPLFQVVAQESFLFEWRTIPESSEMFLRWSLLSGDYRWLKSCRAPPPWYLLTDPPFCAAVRDLPESVAGLAIQTCCFSLAQSAHPADEFLALAEGRPSLSPDAAASLAFIRVLQGHFDSTLAWLRALPRSSGMQVTVESTQALVHLLRGEDAEACAAVERAMEAERGSSRKRVLFPEQEAFAFSLLALLRSGSPPALTRFRELLANARKRRLDSEIVGMLEMASQLLGSEHPRLRVTDEGMGVLSALIVGLPLCWTDSVREPFNRNFVESLQVFIRGVEVCGYRWLAAELQAIANCTVSDDGTTSAHKALGVIPLTRVIPRLEQWEHGLAGLEELARVAKARLQTPVDSRTVRIAWVLQDDRQYGLCVEAREQRLQASGWTKGKIIGLKKLKEAPGDYPALTAADQTLIAAMELTSPHWYQKPRLGLPPAGFVHLVGHPLVFDGKGVAQSVVSDEPALIVDQQADGTIRASVQPRPEGGARVEVYWNKAERRVSVMRVTDDVRKVLEIVPEQGLVLPDAARERLLEVITQLAAEMPVHTNLAGAEGVAREVSPDSEPWLRLTVEGGGLNVQLYVEPVPGSGVTFAPGEGSERLFAQMEGERLRTNRDFKAELAQAQALLQQVPALAELPETDWRGEWVEPDACLELVDALQQAGARCVWPEGESLSIVSRPSASSLSLVVRSAKDWFSASGELAVDENRALGLAQLMKLLEERPRSRFVPLGDGQFVALSKSFRRQLDALRGITQGGGKNLRLHPLAALGLDDLFDAGTVDADEAWHELRERLEKARAFEPVVPGTLQATLRPYQEEGIRWLARLAEWGVGACLADDMGLGKTLQVLGVLLLRAKGGPALVVLPTSLLDNWRREARRFAPTLNVIAYTGAPAERQPLLASLGPFDLVLATYGLVQNDEEQLAAVQWHSVIVDEAQAIKNVATRRSQSVRALKADFRIATTGTPVQNNLMDLFAIFAFVNPGLLGSAERFRSAYALPIERDGDADARHNLARLIAPFILRRTKSEVLDDLPARTEIVRAVTLGPDEAAFYEALRRQALADLEGVGTSGNEQGQFRVLAQLTRLRLACCHPSLVQDTGIRDSAKHAEFMELVGELLQGGHKVLVFSQFVKHLKLIEARLQASHITYQYLDGQTPREQRDRAVTAFQAGEGDVFLISLKAGGAGLNLTAADYVIHMDPWWNPAAEDQASDRAHRIGQTRPVTVYRLVAKGTIEEQIVELHHHKRDLADRLLEGTDASGRLDTAELLALLREPMM